MAQRYRVGGFISTSFFSARYVLGFFSLRKKGNRASEIITIPLEMIEDSLRLNLWHSFLAQSRSSDGNKTGCASSELP